MSRIGRNIALIAGLLAFAMIPAGCIPIQLGEVRSATTSTTKHPAMTMPAQSTTPAKVGTSLRAGSWEVTVAHARTSATGPGGAKAASGKTFLLVETVFRNVLMRESLLVDPKDASLKSASGKKRAMVGTTSGYNARGMRVIGAGLGGSTVFAFEIPKGSSRHTFTFSPKESGKRVRLQWSVP